KTLGITEFIEKQFDMSSHEESEEIYKIIQEKIQSKSLNEWLDIFRDVNTCLQPIKTLSEVKNDKHLHERKMILEVPHPAGGSYFTTNLPIKFSEWNINSNPRKPPDMGENTLSILKEFGIGDNLTDDFI
ncbi:MAG: CoA transferase, partial [Candidatus Hodarchaeales archaeon]